MPGRAGGCPGGSAVPVLPRCPLQQGCRALVLQRAQLGYCRSSPVTCLLSLCFELPEIHKCAAANLLVLSSSLGVRSLLLKEPVPSGLEGIQTHRSEAPSKEVLQLCPASCLGQGSWCRLILEPGSVTLCFLLPGARFTSQRD